MKRIKSGVFALATCSHSGDDTEPLHPMNTEINYPSRLNGRDVLRISLFTFLDLLSFIKEYLVDTYVLVYIYIKTMSKSRNV